MEQQAVCFANGPYVQQKVPSPAAVSCRRRRDKIPWYHFCSPAYLTHAGLIPDILRPSAPLPRLPHMGACRFRPFHIFRCNRRSCQSLSAGLSRKRLTRSGPCRRFIPATPKPSSARPRSLPLSILPAPASGSFAFFGRTLRTIGNLSVKPQQTYFLFLRVF